MKNTDDRFLIHLTKVILFGLVCGIRYDERIKTTIPISKNNSYRLQIDESVSYRLALIRHGYAEQIALTKFIYSLQISLICNEQFEAIFLLICCCVA